MNRLLLARLAGILILLVPCMATADWFDGNWPYRKPIVIDSTKVTGDRDPGYGSTAKMTA